MQVKVIIALFAFCAISSASLLPRSAPALNRSLGHLLMKSSLDIEQNPTRSVECFSVYVPQLNKLTAQYEAQYANCLQETDDSKQVVESEVKENRTQITETANNICSQFAACNATNISLEFFSCYASAANEATKTTYTIGLDANEAVELIQRRYAEIEYVQNRCTTKASNEYVEETSKVYAELDDCLAGKPVPEKTTTTPEPTTEI